MSCEARAAEVLRVSGQRRTGSRLLVLSILNHTGCHMAATEIVEQVLRAREHVSPSTVYRALASLRDAGVVSETLLPGGETRYEWSEQSPGHHHLMCRECGATTDLGSGYFADLEKQLARDYGFRADMSHIALHGVCSNCTSR